MREPLARLIEHRESSIWAYCADKLVELVRLVRVPLLWGLEAGGPPLLQQRQRTDFPEQAVLGVVHPPKRLGCRLVPGQHALVAHAPCFKHLEPGREILVRYPQIHVSTARIGEIAN